MSVWAKLFQSQLGQWLLLQTSHGSRVSGLNFSHCWAGEQLFPKHRADGGINTVIQRGFVNTKNKQARRCVLEGHVQAQHFRGQWADFSDFLSVSCPRCWSSFCCNFPGFRGLAEVVLEASCHLKPARGFPPGWYEEKAGMCFQTRIFDPSFWRGEADQVETQMDPADPISLWWQKIGKVRAVRQWAVKPFYSNGPRKWWFWKCHFCWFGEQCLDETTGSEKVEGSPASGWDGNDTTGIGVMSTGFVNIFLFWCSLFKLQMRLTESFRDRGSLIKNVIFGGTNVSTLKQWKLWYF